jgi:hypothetical protein
MIYARQRGIAVRVLDSYGSLLVLLLALAPLSSTVESDVRELLAAMSAPEHDPESIANLLHDDLTGWPRWP